MIYTSMDICIMWGALIYLVLGVIISFTIVKMLCKDKKTNRHGYSLDKFANEHALEVFIIMLLWPVYIFMALVVTIFVMFMKRFKR